MPAFSPPGGHSSRHTITATRRPAGIPEDLARDMILNGWDEEPIGGIDSGSDTQRHREQTEEKEVPDVSKKQSSQSHQLLLEMQYPSVQWSQPKANSL
ncbi:hypothetical protein MHYP_G00171210 [Metynnis hypsauchen]